MVTVKEIILTAIHYKGIEQVKKEAPLNNLPENSICSVAYIRSIIRKVENGEIEIK